MYIYFLDCGYMERDMLERSYAYYGDVAKMVGGVLYAHLTPGCSGECFERADTGCSSATSLHVACKQPGFSQHDVAALCLLRLRTVSISNAFGPSVVLLLLPPIFFNPPCPLPAQFPLPRPLLLSTHLPSPHLTIVIFFLLPLSLRCRLTLNLPPQPRRPPN